VEDAMAIVGNHMRTTVSPILRAETRKFYCELMGCGLKSPSDDLDLFIFENEVCLGVYYSTKALSDAQIENAVWLEVKVKETHSFIAKLEQAGIKRHEYVDKEHYYFRAPGGQLYRLAEI
jgi:hypothetical protein